ncbi:MAG TPA: DUF3616 domain-containing protein [Noviherbaspirillum sp.]|nr:DUF3616 domain-containing protein [Noviherbaspirillum sp.]
MIVRRRFLHPLFLSALFISSCVEASPLVEFAEMCDASAAVSIGKSGFLIANDEDNVLRLYERSTPDKPPRTFDVGAILQPEGKEKHAEADIEGATVIGNRIYWIGSHGSSADGESRPNRRRLFATEIGGSGDAVTVTPVGTPFRDLVVALSSDQRLRKYKFKEAAGKSPESSGALNIEGLAATPGKALLIGFRNPVHAGKALLVPLENPDAVLESSEKPKLGSPIELPLGGLGIRSIEFVPAMNAYLIVAGPYDSRKDFKLYKWSGKKKEAPQLVASDFASQADFRPEAFVQYPGEKASIDVFSDDGDRIVGTKECKKNKDEAKRTFRGITVTLP